MHIHIFGCMANFQITQLYKQFLAWSIKSKFYDRAFQVNLPLFFLHSAWQNNIQKINISVVSKLVCILELPGRPLNISKPRPPQTNTSHSLGVRHWHPYIWSSQSDSIVEKKGTTDVCRGVSSQGTFAHAIPCPLDEFLCSLIQTQFKCSSLNLPWCHPTQVTWSINPFSVFT